MTRDWNTRPVGKTNGAALYVELSRAGGQLRIRREGGGQVAIDLDEARRLAEALLKVVVDQAAGDEMPAAIAEEWRDDDTCAKCGERTIVAHPVVEGEVVCPDCDE